ncbi:hypothetical protein IV38_GL000163 [Lactobacillus selangorensis]|uniref:Uncharacterized protein n=1 Tax=Lactobacillus selangorensis TaxID=81857 RepID=A0A0R2FKX5_9LACO|nr:hypothetical protein [Lactobacillus selangorensis]KRN29281.1 hypothetical protein IV38_GL000163 [Lactobacillus selangorensis]KRN34190.1 hypothetical protein IV40_GL000506 [Lactobacillus selangorensis]
MQNFHVTITPYVQTYFTDPQQQAQLTEFFMEKLPLYLQQRPAKIKPVHGHMPHLFELKVRIGRTFYRAAFLHTHDQIQVVYITDILQKVKFDRKANHFLAQQA